MLTRADGYRIVDSALQNAGGKYVAGSGITIVGDTAIKWGGNITDDVYLYFGGDKYLGYYNLGGYEMGTVVEDNAQSVAFVSPANNEITTYYNSDIARIGTSAVLNKVRFEMGIYSGGQRTIVGGDSETLRFYQADGNYFIHNLISAGVDYTKAIVLKDTVIDGVSYTKFAYKLLTELGADGNNYVTGGSVSGSNLVLNRNGLSNLSIDVSSLVNVAEADPIALAKTITINGNAQALSDNPTFTINPTLTPIAYDPVVGGVDAFTVTTERFITLRPLGGAGNGSLTLPAPSSVAGQMFVLAIQGGGGTGKWQTTASITGPDGYGTTTTTFDNDKVYTLLSDGSTYLIKNIYTESTTATTEVYAPYTVTYTATPTFDYNNSVNQEMTLTGNVTSITLSNIPDGKTMYIKFKQDATGSRTVSGWGASGKIIGGALTLTTAGNAEDIVGIKRMGSNYYITYGKDYK